MPGFGNQRSQVKIQCTECKKWFYPRLGVVKGTCGSRYCKPSVNHFDRTVDAKITAKVKKNV